MERTWPEGLDEVITQIAEDPGRVPVDRDRLYQFVVDFWFAALGVGVGVGIAFGVLVTLLMNWLLNNPG